MGLVYSFGVPANLPKLIQAKLANLSLSSQQASIERFFGISAGVAALELSGFSASVESDETTAALQADWERRSQAPGVIWATNFATAADVNNWRFTNQNNQAWDPSAVQSLSNLIRWESSGGIIPGTGFLRCESHSGGASPCVWWRTLDPAASSGTNTENFVIEPGHPIHLQFRCRMNTARLANIGTESTGLKVAEICTAAHTLVNQGCHIMRSGSRQYVQISNTAAGGASLPWNYVEVTGDFDMQPGSVYGFCSYNGGDSASGCWLIPADEWVTYHLTYVPGTVDEADTYVRLEVAGPNDTEYTLIYERWDNTIVDELEDAGGLSAIALWNRDENSSGLVSGCYHDFDEVIVSHAPIPCPNPTVSPPDWVLGLTVGRWAAISLNTISQLNPENDPDLNPNYPDIAPWRGDNGQAGVIHDWQGGAIARTLGTHGALLYCGAGHNGYHGNEVYMFDIGSRLWSRITDPAPYNVAEHPNEMGEMPDGTPILPHTYDLLEFHEPTKSLVVTRLERNSAGGQEIARMAMLDLTDIENPSWRYTPKGSEKGGYAGCSWLDTNRHIVCNEGGGESGKRINIYRPLKSDFTDGTWDQSIDTKIGEIDTVVAFDPVRDIAVLASYDGSTLKAIDCSDIASAAVTLTQSGSGLNTSRCGWEYSPVRDAFIQHRLGTSDVKQCKLTSGDWDDGTWTWSSLLDSGNSVTPENNSSGMYSRFRLMNWGDVEIALVCNSTTGSVYAFRLS